MVQQHDGENHANATVDGGNSHNSTETEPLYKQHERMSGFSTSTGQPQSATPVYKPSPKSSPPFQNSAQEIRPYYTAPQQNVSTGAHGTQGGWNPGGTAYHTAGSQGQRVGAGAPSSDYSAPSYHQQGFSNQGTAQKASGAGRKARYTAGFIALLLCAGAAGFAGSMLATQQNGSVITESIVNTSDNVSSGQGATVADVVAATAGAVVEIQTEAVQTSSFMQQYTAAGAGSGIIITSDGYIVTNNHVISETDRVTVTLNNGQRYDAELIGQDETTDLAVIKIDATDLQAVVLGDSNAIRVGDLAIAIGNPLGELGGTVTEGIISALDREITIDNQDMTLLQTSAAVNPGNSGGGLFNGKGELIGIVNAKTSASGIEGLGFAIPSSTAKPIVEDIIKNGYVTGRIRLGVSFLDITTDQAARQYRVTELGAYVYQVNPKSDAQKAGLQVGDLVHKVGDVKVYQSSEIKEQMKNYNVGDTMDLTIKRNGEEVVLSVTFTEYSARQS